VADIYMSQNKTYKVRDLYQWDTKVLLTIYGLSLSKAPEIHFANVGSEEAIVKQADMDDSGIISVQIPDSVLQVSGNLNVYIYGYEADESRTMYHLTIKIVGRAKPLDYIAEDDDKIYSYNALENKVDNVVRQLVIDDKALHTQIINEVKGLYNNLVVTVNEDLEETKRIVTGQLNNTLGLYLSTKSQTTTFNADGSITTIYDDGTSEHTTFNADGSITQRLDWGDLGTKIVTTRVNANGSITVTTEEGK
jgi:hypothetical protein